MKRSVKSVTVSPSIDESGHITGYASTFTRTPDWYGDVIAKGAFADWIERTKAEGTVVPLLFNHQQNLNSFIGKVTSIEEDDHGLLFSADFDATPDAQRARELAMDGRLAKFSFAYAVLEDGTVTLEDGTKAHELRRLDVDEVSLVLQPANPDTSVVEVKSGRRNSHADAEVLRSMRDLASQITESINGLLADEDGQDEADVPEPDANAEEPDGANAEEPTDEAADADAQLDAAKAYAKAILEALEA